MLLRGEKHAASLDISTKVNGTENVSQKMKELDKIHRASIDERYYFPMQCA